MSRRTDQRDAICAVLAVAGRPLAPQEVLEAAQNKVPRLGMATVYRNLKALLSEGWITALERPGGGTLYELAARDHHHHFHCQTCGRVFDVEGCVAELEHGLPPGFSVTGHQVLLYGRCDHCNQPS